MTPEEFYARNPGAMPQPGAPAVVNPVSAPIVEPVLTAQQKLNQFAGRDLAQPEVVLEPEYTPAGVNAEFSQPQQFTTPSAAVPVPAAPAGTDAYGRALNKVVKGYEIEGKAAQELADKEAVAIDEQAKALQGRQAARELELAERKQINEQRKVDLDESQKAYVAAQQEAGTNYWENKSTGSKIAAAIAQALGAYGAALTGTQNFAAQTIENSIRQDAELKVRKAQLAKDRTSAVAQRYDSLMDQLKDEGAVKDVIVADGLAITKAKLDAMGARAKSEDAKARILKGTGELEIKIAQLREEAAEKAAKAALAANGGREAYVPGLKGYATSKEGAAKLNEIAGATNSAKNSLNKLLQLSKTAAGSLSPEQRQEAETTATLARAALRVPILGPGVVNEREAALLERVVSNPNTIFSMDNVSRKALTTLIDRLDSNLVEQGRAYGVEAPQGMGGGEIKIIGGRRYEKTPQGWKAAN